MRHLLNLLDYVSESRGLSARLPGSSYARSSEADDQIVFQNLEFYPKVGS